MKKIILLIGFLSGSVSYGGQSPYIPMQLVEMDNMGRIEFLANAAEASGLVMAETTYTDLESVVIGGDLPGSDFLGALFEYSVVLNANQRTRHRCYQRLAVGNFEESLSTPVFCESVESN